VELVAIARLDRELVRSDRRTGHLLPSVVAVRRRDGPAFLPPRPRRRLPNAWTS
jgi:hypothetical protein